MRTQRSMLGVGGLRRKLRPILAVAVLATPIAAWTGGGSGSAPANAKRTPANLAGDVLIAGGAFAPAPATPTRTPRPGPSPTPVPLPPPAPGQTARLPAGTASQTTASAGALPAEVYNPSTGRLTKTGRMVAVRFNHTATLLGDGKVLIAGGCCYLSSAELYDPSTATFSATGGMASRRRSAAAVLLRNGRVLVTGGGIGSFVGLRASFCRGLPLDSTTGSAELYDPRTGRFAAAGRMRQGRELHTATLLNDGTVLIAGGTCGLNTTELYLPGSARFVATGAGPMTVGRRGHTATLLADGEVLIAGGIDEDGKILASAELYDPSTGAFTATGSMNQPRRVATATLLTNGDVLVAGGLSPSGQFEPSAVASAELYDPSSGSFTPTGPMSTPRAGHTGTLLDDGRVLIAGGDGTAAELYDPVTGSFSPTGDLAFPRFGATATLLR